MWFLFGEISSLDVPVIENIEWIGHLKKIEVIYTFFIPFKINSIVMGRYLLV